MGGGHTREGVRIMQQATNFETFDDCSNAAPAESYSPLAAPLMIDPFCSQPPWTQGYRLVFLRPVIQAEDAAKDLEAFVERWAGSEIDVDQNLEAASAEHLCSGDDVV